MYRDELEAARARILALEERVAELEGVGKKRGHDSSVAVATWAPLALALGGEVGATLLAMADQDRAAELFMSYAMVAAAAAACWSWGRTGPGRAPWLLGFLGVKAAAIYVLPRIAQATKAFWMCGRITQAEQCLGVFDLPYYAFWYQPLGLVLVSVIEALVLRELLPLHAQRSS
jgi:hypothetical protein